MLMDAFSHRGGIEKRHGGQMRRASGMRSASSVTYRAFPLPKNREATDLGRLCLFLQFFEAEGLYVTLLAECMRGCFASVHHEFFDPATVGEGIHYISGYEALRNEGLKGDHLIRKTIKRDGATLWSSTESPAPKAGPSEMISRNSSTS